MTIRLKKLRVSHENFVKPKNENVNPATINQADSVNSSYVAGRYENYLSANQTPINGAYSSTNSNLCTNCCTLLYLVLVLKLKILQWLSYICSFMIFCSITKIKCDHVVICMVYQTAIWMSTLWVCVHLYPHTSYRQFSKL